MKPLYHKLILFNNGLSALNLKLLPQCMLLNHMYAYSNWLVISYKYSPCHVRASRDEE